MNVQNALMVWVRYKQLEWYGHVRRFPEAKITRLIWNWIPQERVKRSGEGFQNFNGKTETRGEKK